MALWFTVEEPSANSQVNERIEYIKPLSGAVGFGFTQNVQRDGFDRSMICSMQAYVILL